MIKQRIKIVIKNIDMMLLILILIASTLCVRNEIRIRILPIIINIVMIIYFCIRLFMKKPIQVIQNKLDICVILLVVSSFVPLIANSYISLYSTVMNILQYVTLFWIYLLAREIVKENEYKSQIFQNSIIFITILMILVGVENLTTNKIFEFFNIDYIINGESRLVSLFGNPNVFSALIIFSWFLSMHQTIYCTNETKKCIYSTINVILISGFILTYSKAMFLIFPLMLIVYIFYIKDKEKIIYVFQNLIISLFIAGLFVYVFSKLIVIENYFLIFVFSIFLFVLAILFNLFNIKTTKFVSRINLKTILFCIVIMTFTIVIVLKIELQKGKEFIVFHPSSSINYNAKKIRNIQPNQKYIFSFDIDAQMELLKLENEQDLFTINIIQKDSKNGEILNQEETFGEFSGTKEIEIQTTEKTSEIKIEFKSKYQNMMKRVVINQFKINGQEYILEYQYLPTKLVEKIKDISLNYKTAQERIQFIKDGFKLISQNFLTGIGGDGWLYKYKEVQEYAYVSNDTHSYFIQVWLEFGLLGIISLIAIVWLVVQSDSRTYQGIKFGLLVLLLHSAIDSDMYFFHMKLVFFVSLGILNILPKEKVLYNQNKKDYGIQILLVVVASITILLYVKPRSYQKNIRINELEAVQIGKDVESEEYKEINKELVNSYDELMKYERTDSVFHEYEIRKIQAFLNSGQNDIEEILEQYYNKIVDYVNKCKYDTEKIIAKSNSVNNVMDLLIAQNNPQFYPWIVKLAQIILNDFESTKEQLRQVIQEKYENVEDSNDYNFLISNYMNAQNAYNTYFLGIRIYNTTETDLKQYISQDYELSIENKKDIIIYHTHTTEGYISDEEDNQKTEYGKTLNSKYNILSVGNELQENLQKNNFNVEHIQDYHDLEGITGAYTRSFETLQKKLSEQSHKTEIIFDIHRDAYQGGDKSIIKINGEDVAKLRFVIAIGHEGWENNLRWAVTLQKKADELYPGLFQTMYIYDKTYNQSASKYATLVEVGDNENTVEEAQRSMTYFAEIINDCLLENNL